MKKQKVICNKCGRKLKIENDILREDALVVNKEWGYFSHKDLQLHRFCLCEECYDEMVAGFVIPPDVKNKEVVLEERCQFMKE